jgi:hypothetical protein
VNVSPIDFRGIPFGGNVTSPNFSRQPTIYPAVFTCSQTYTLTAVPKSVNYKFSRWEGDYTGSSNPLTVSISDGAKSVIAYFVYDPDLDGDGFTVSEGDCNNNDVTIYPGAQEICGDGKDNDCDGSIDNGCNTNIVPPSTLTAIARSSTQIMLAWKDNSNNETGFKIDKKAGDCNSLNPWTELASKAENATTHTVAGLTPNTTYSFKASAYDVSGSSSYSNCVSAKTGASGTPPSPTNLKATSDSSTKVNLTWSDTSTNETGFKIYRKAGAGAWSLLTTTGSNIKNFSDTTATNNSSTTIYKYFVVASNASGNSPSTYSATITYQPINLKATQGTSNGTVILTWTDKSINETGFEIYLKSGSCSSTSTWTKAATIGANKTSWTHRSLASGSKYSYKIRAYKKTGSVLPAYGYSMYSGCSAATAP